MMRIFFFRLYCFIIIVVVVVPFSGNNDAAAAGAANIICFSSGMLIWNCSNTTKYVTIVVNSCTNYLLNSLHFFVLLSSLTPLNKFRLTSKKPPQLMLDGFISVARKNILISV